MKDFLDQLDDRLAAIAAQPEMVAAPVAPSRRARTLRRTIVGSLTGGLAAVAAIFAMTGTSLADLPILSTPTTDATNIRGALPAARKAGVDFSKAHVFGTPGGPGYVLVTPEQNTVCIALPDPTAPGDYGSSCGTPLEKVEREGLAAELVGDRSSDPRATSVFAFVLPDDAEDVRLRTRGRERRATPESGVVVAEITTETDVLWTVDGHPAKRRFQGPFEAAGGLFSCPDGKVVELSPSEAASTGQGKGPSGLDPQVLRRACR